MTNYKINVKYGNVDINDIFTKVLKRELKNYIKMICNNNEKEVTYNSTYLSLKEGGKNYLFRE